MADVPALVLDDPSVASEEPRHFAGFPGLWAPGAPVLVASLGFESDDAAYARVEELGLPLVETAAPLPATEPDGPALLELNAPDAIAAIGELTDPDELFALRQAEGDGKNRKTVMQALVERLDALVPPGDGV